MKLRDIRKLGSSLAATALLVGLSTGAAAGTCEDLAGDLSNLAGQLRCAEYGDAHVGYYNKNNPLWEKRGQPSCDVHESLATKLSFDRAITGEPPVVKKGGNAKGGAAQDVLNGNRDAAYLKLDEFLYDLSVARDNDQWVPPADPTADDADKSESYFVGAVEAIQAEIYSCTTD